MHHEAQRLGASTTSSSPLRCMSQRVAFRPLVSRVASVTSSNSKLNRDALASTSREVMSLVFAVKVADPRDRPMTDANTVVDKMASRVTPPIIANRIISGLVADDRCGRGVGVEVCEVLMSFPVVVAGRSARWRPGFQCAPGQLERVGCQCRLLQVQVFGILR